MAPASTSQPTWIALCQKTRVDPQNVVNNNVDRLFELVLTASVPVTNVRLLVSASVRLRLTHIQSPASLALAEASYQAITTLAFVSPQIVLQRALNQLRIDIDPAVINSVTQTEFAIWATPEGKTFIDGNRPLYSTRIGSFMLWNAVLSSKKSEVQPRKGKDAEISQWEADIRKSLANKKPTNSVALTKEEQALVQAQLEKESVIRQRVASIKANLGRGLRIIRSLVAAGSLDSKMFLSSMVPLLLEGVFHSVFADRMSCERYLVRHLIPDNSLYNQKSDQDLGKSCASRLETFREWAGLATLRSLDVKVVPEEFQVEAISCTNFMNSAGIFKSC